MNRLRPLLCLMLCLCLLPAFALAEGLVYGQSEQGRQLLYYALGQEDAAQSLLMVFGIHGFEDEYDRDGQMLFDLAHALISHYQQNPQALQGWRLYIVPSANPDGLEAGTSKDGFGRCNANGLNINRDFPVGWKHEIPLRNLNGQEPFATAEARALRDLALSLAPTYGVDVHGWINGVYGDDPVADCFHRAFRIDKREYRAGGMLSQWLSTVTQGAAMVELPPRPADKGYLEKVLTKTINALSLLMEQEEEP